MRKLKYAVPTPSGHDREWRRLLNAPGLHHDDVPDAQIHPQILLQTPKNIPNNLVRFPRWRPYINDMMSDDMALLREYAENNSEQAFATLVSRQVNLAEDKPSECLTMDARMLIVSVSVGWRISDPKAFSLKFPGDSALAVQRQLEELLPRAKAAVIGRHNFSDCVNFNPSELKLDRIGKEIQTALEMDLTTNNYGVSIAALNCLLYVP